MLGPWQIVIIILLVLVLFGGRGKITSIMGDMASGIKAFKKGMAEDEPEKPAADQTALSDASVEPLETAEKTKTE
ncbi:MAG: twin-arginine translocase TatA/TatE family subunit [Parvularcula sp.]